MTADDEVEAAHRIIWPATEWNDGEHACREIVRAALSAAAKVRAIREGDGEVVPRPLDLREMDADDEAVEWVSRNLHGLRHDSGTIEYTLASVVRAFQAGKALAATPAATGGEGE